VPDSACPAPGSARGKARGKRVEPPAKPTAKLEPLSPELLSFFAQRGISPAVVERNLVQQERRWSHKRERYVDMIGVHALRPRRPASWPLCMPRCAHGRP
jgi:hypothetical protein